MKLLQKVYHFLRYPKYQEYRYSNVWKRRLFFNLLGLKLAFALIAAMLLGLVNQLVGFDLGGHSLENILQEYSPLMIFFLVVIFAPVIEELIFRAPLALFRTSRHFRFALYFSVFAFGFIHLFNFEEYYKYFWMAPLLVLPQLIAGVFLAFIRVRMGLVYSMLLHAAFNCIIISPFLLVQSLKPLLN